MFAFNYVALWDNGSGEEGESQVSVGKAGIFCNWEGDGENPTFQTGVTDLENQRKFKMFGLFFSLLRPPDLWGQMRTEAQVKCCRFFWCRPLIQPQEIVHGHIESSCKNICVDSSSSIL